MRTLVVASPPRLRARWPAGLEGGEPRALAARSILAAALLATSVASATAQPVAEFYKGKTITVLIGYPPGGSYDLIARTLVRHMGRHLPGSPQMIPQNMPGAGSKIAAKHLYSVAPQDGTVLATISQYIALGQLLEEDKSFDSARMHWIGNLGQGGNNVMAAWAATGVRTIEDVKKRPLFVGSTGPQTNTEYYPAVLNALFGTQFRLVRGYTGFAPTVLALERGELEGSASADWPGWKLFRPEWIKERRINIILQIGTVREKELPDVPLLTDLARSQEERQILDLVTSGVDMGRPYAAGPGVPADRVAALRAAFLAMLKDPQFQADATKQSLALTPTSGEEVQALVEATMKAPAAIVARTRAALTPEQSAVSQKKP